MIDCGFLIIVDIIFKLFVDMDGFKIVFEILVLFLIDGIDGFVWIEDDVDFWLLVVLVGNIKLLCDVNSFFGGGLLVSEVKELIDDGLISGFFDKFKFSLFVVKWDRLCFVMYCVGEIEMVDFIVIGEWCVMIVLELSKVFIDIWFFRDVIGVKFFWVVVFEDEILVDVFCLDFIMFFEFFDDLCCRILVFIFIFLCIDIKFLVFKVLKDKNFCFFWIVVFNLENCFNKSLISLLCLLLILVKFFGCFILDFFIIVLLFFCFFICSLVSIDDICFSFVEMLLSFEFICLDILLELLFLGVVFIKGNEKLVEFFKWFFVLWVKRFCRWFNMFLILEIECINLVLFFSSFFMWWIVWWNIGFVIILLVRVWIIFFFFCNLFSVLLSFLSIDVDVMVSDFVLNFLLDLGLRLFGVVLVDLLKWLVLMLFDRNGVLGNMLVLFIFILLFFL